VVQGDTATASVATLAAFLQQVPVFHVEAGLRTYNLDAPWPEEGNRRVISAIATYHFAPTASCRANLLREGVAHERAFVTGNTIVDALSAINERLAFAPVELPAPVEAFLAERRDQKLVLVTSHRRENSGTGFRQIAAAIKALARTDRFAFVLPIHPNPAVGAAFAEALKDVGAIHLCRPLEYGPFVQLLARAWLVLSDSGGLQEEAACLRKPILILRNQTERPEVLECGMGALVGADAARIEAAVLRLSCDPELYGRMTRGDNPFGDGRAGTRIAAHIDRCLNADR
jgi:UDP-N-acetylglucosamine 2-epimerase (non-hydrolysing)